MRSYAAGSPFAGLAFGDLNQDGIPDAVTSDSARNLIVLIGNGDRSLAESRKRDDAWLLAVDDKECRAQSLITLSAED